LAGDHKQQPSLLLNIFQRKSAHLIALGILAAGLYAKTLDFDFILTWDDQVYVVNNPDLQDLSWNGIRSLATKTYIGNYLPVQMLSYVIDRIIGGMSPGVFHLLNSLLHVANVLLCYLLLRRLVSTVWICVAVTAIFAVHPVNVEAVAWISQRKTVLSSLLFFGTVLTYLRWRDSGSRTTYLAAVFFFLLSVFTKTSVILLPAILALHSHFWFREDRRLNSLFSFMLISIAGAGGTVLASSGSAILAGTMNAEALLGGIYPTMVPIYWKYVGLLLFPHQQSAFYDTTVYRSFVDPAVAFSLLAWVALLWWVFRRGSNQVRFWSAWAILCFLPMSNVIPFQVFYADRFLYLSLIGFFTALFTCFGEVLEQAGSRLRGRLRFQKAIAAGAIVLVTFPFAAVSWHRLDVWRNEVTLWEDTVLKSPGLPNPQLYLALAYLRRGRLQEAERWYVSAAQLQPTPEAFSRIRYVRELIRMQQSP
jgi:hypothetical protein